MNSHLCHHPVGQYNRKVTIFTNKSTYDLNIATCFGLISHIQVYHLTIRDEP